MLTYGWRWRGIGVAIILSAAGDIVVFERGETLLSVILFGETAPLLILVYPGIEAVVASARSIHARAFIVLACTQTLPIVICEEHTDSVNRKAFESLDTGS